MSETVISVENLGKKYRIRHQQRERYTALRDVIAHKFAAPWHWLAAGRSKNGAGSLHFNSQLPSPISQPFNPSSPQLLNSSTPSVEDFWALRNVSFEVKQGEVVGIIGRNGAGKSTLLKVLSRITEPTEGRVRIKGRVASLLEVGTGFHPELTGRENIFLNGAILGMTRVEIKKKFDEIVVFAEVEKFLDTPVKRYSSGMYVRLAFAVAAHLEPEILIVDEVLAVGDAEFQKKCLGKMREVSKGGRTVLFVSHNMQAVLALCESACLLNHGRINAIGNTRGIVSHYLASGAENTAHRQWSSSDSAPGNEIVRLHSVRATTKSGVNANSFDIREPIGLEMQYEVLAPGHVLWFGFNLHNSDGVNIFDVHSTNSIWYNQPHPEGRFWSVAWIPGNLLAEGVITVGAAIFNHQAYKIHFHERDVIAFTVIDNIAGDSARGNTTGIFPGVIRPMLAWETMQMASSKRESN